MIGLGFDPCRVGRRVYDGVLNVPVPKRAQIKLHLWVDYATNLTRFEPLCLDLGTKQ